MLLHITQRILELGFRTTTYFFNSVDRTIKGLHGIIMKLLCQAQALKFHAVLETAVQLGHFQFEAFLLGDIFDDANDQSRSVCFHSPSNDCKDGFYPYSGLIPVNGTMLKAKIGCSVDFRVLEKLCRLADIVGMQKF